MFKVTGVLALLTSFALVLSSSAGDDAKSKKKGKFGEKFSAEAMFKKLDANNDGKLTWDEYLKIAEKIPDQTKAEKAKEFLGKAFEKAANGGDSVSLEQFKKMREEMIAKFKKKTDNK